MAPRITEGMIPDDYRVRVRALRVRMTITQAELAEQLGVHTRTVQDWERGKAQPGAANWRKILALEEEYSPG